MHFMQRSQNLLLFLGHRFEESVAVLNCDVLQPKIYCYSTENVMYQSS
jgi:hypothetical protein